MLQAADYRIGPLIAVRACSALGKLSQPFLIRPCGLPSRMFQPDRDRAYRASSAIAPGMALPPASLQSCPGRPRFSSL